ncbi:MAG TPA: cytochrome d ubiquinol oxidase subunit II, partial [Candidatus Hydrogenedentes bacterium]|nr:cytochrome d ubiquinol oxidase subunit II [Candidatus Hydrogenedentota bacterium]
LFGVAVGNVLRGLAIKDLVYQGTFFSFLNPYSLLTGLLVVALFALHGALYLRLKSEGELQAQTEGWIRRALMIFVVLYGIVVVYTLMSLPHARTSVISWLVFPLSVLAIYGIRASMRKGKPMKAFLCSAANIALMVLSFAAAMFPNLVISSIDAASNLDIWNAANSPKTLAIMLGIVCGGLPFVLAYTAWIYWIFRGKVGADTYY